MASHNFIRNEVFDENVDRLNELTRFVITQRKLAEYDALIAELDAQRIELGGVMPRDQAAIDVVVARLRDVRDEKRQFETERSWVSNDSAKLQRFDWNDNETVQRRH